MKNQKLSLSEKNIEGLSLPKLLIWVIVFGCVFLLANNTIIYRLFPTEFASLLRPKFLMIALICTFAVYVSTLFFRKQSDDKQEVKNNALNIVAVVFSLLVWVFGLIMFKLFSNGVPLNGKMFLVALNVSGIACVALSFYLSTCVRYDKNNVLGASAAYAGAMSVIEFITVSMAVETIIPEIYSVVFMESTVFWGIAMIIAGVYLAVVEKQKKAASKGKDIRA